MTPAQRRLVPALLCLVLAVGLSGCGVGATDRPMDVGDAAAGGVTGTGAARRDPPTWSPEDSAGDLVSNFLQTAAGGYSAANDRMKQYLTPNALAGWHDPVPADNPPLSVVRVVSGPDDGIPVGDRTPFTLTYQTVGTLSDLGRVDDVAQFVTRTLVFWVVPEQNSAARIDEIDGWPEGQLLLSDIGLRTYYQAQPIYFWDLGAELLVPDVRYLSLSLNVDQRANTVLRWLTTGPSPWLGAVSRLPSGTVLEGLVIQADNSVVVNLSAEAAGAGDPETLRRLMFQLQWSLSGISGGSVAPEIELRIDDVPVTVDADENDFRQYNHSWTYRQATRYDVAPDGVVVATGEESPPVLATQQNSGVYAAAIDRDASTAAFVRWDGSGRRYLQIVRDDEPALTTAVPPDASLGRPSFVPDAEFVLVPTGGSDGRLLAVSVVDGSYTDASHGLTGITAAVVSPDGRRVALVSNGAIYTASLSVTASEVNLSTPQRQLLAGQLDARAVTWLSESSLLVGGTSTSGSSPALWEVSADGVLAEDLSGTMGGLGRVDDLVCYPLWTQRGAVDVLASTPLGVYTFRSGPSQTVGLTAPFYGS